MPILKKSYKKALMGFKKIMSASQKFSRWLIAPIVTAIIMWGAWVTGQSYSLKQTKTTVDQHVVTVQKQQDYIQHELEELKKQMQLDKEQINEKLDKNKFDLYSKIDQDNRNFYNLLLSIQKQIGGKNG